MMAQAQVDPDETLKHVLQVDAEHKRLTTAVSFLAREVERLNEDNLQLRAAISLYREAARRYGPRSTQARAKTMVA